MIKSSIHDKMYVVGACMGNSKFDIKPSKELAREHVEFLVARNILIRDKSSTHDKFVSRPTPENFGLLLLECFNISKERFDDFLSAMKPRGELTGEHSHNEAEIVPRISLRQSDTFRFLLLQAVLIFLLECEDERYLPIVDEILFQIVPVNESSKDFVGFVRMLTEKHLSPSLLVPLLGWCQSYIPSLSGKLFVPSPKKEELIHRKAKWVVDFVQQISSISYGPQTNFRHIHFDSKASKVSIVLSNGTETKDIKVAPKWNPLLGHLLSQLSQREVGSSLAVYLSADEIESWANKNQVLSFSPTGKRNKFQDLLNGYRSDLNKRVYSKILQQPEKGLVVPESSQLIRFYNNRFYVACSEQVTVDGFELNA